MVKHSRSTKKYLNPLKVSTIKCSLSTVGHVRSYVREKLTDRKILTYNHGNLVSIVTIYARVVL